MSIARALRAADKGKPRRAPRVVLPPMPEPFIGRSDEAAAVHTILRSAQTGRRLLLNGEPGVGKTWLALSVAHQAAEEGRYDGVIWLDCQQVRLSRDGALVAPSTGVRNVEDLLRELAIAADAEGALKGTAANLPTALRAYLAGRRMLVIVDAFDDIADPQAEMELLRLPDSVDVLATSRSRMQWPQVVPVRPFDIQSDELGAIARHVLQDQNVPITPVTLGLVVDLSAGIPLTITWLAFLLRHGTAPTDLETALAQPGSNLFLYYFERTWHTLSQDEMLMKATVFVAMARPTTVATATAVLSDGGGWAARAGAALSRLDDLNILMREDDDIDIAPSLRHVVLNRVLQDHPTIVDDVLALWLTSLIDRCRRAADQANWTLVFASLDDVRPEILGVLRWAAKSTVESVRDGAAELLWLTVYYLFSRGYWDAMREAASDLLPSFVKGGRTVQALEIHLTWLLRVVRHREGILAARKFFHEVATGLRKQRDLPGAMLRRYLHTSRGTLRLDDSPRTDLAKRLESDSRAFQVAGEAEWACRAMLLAGNVWSEAGAMRQAVDAFNWVDGEAKRVPPAPWAAEMRSLAAGNLGVVENRRREFSLAARLLADSLAGLAQTVDQATAHAELSRALWETGRLRTARRHAQYSQELVQRLNLVESVTESSSGWDQALGARIARASLPKLVLMRLRDASHS